MEAPYAPAWEKDGVMVVEEDEEKREGREQEEGETGGSSPAGSAEEETDEDEEPEPPPVSCRKVSFADAFGLNLVSVKEFDNADPTESEVSEPPQREAIHPSEEFYMSRLFTAPSTPEELDQRLREQRVELESIELLPGTTTLRGIIRVVNLCYSKSVYVRITHDGWGSHFDLLAEYVPGSSDRKTDGFAFTYSLSPPFEREGTRVEFCLRYETSAGTFWANNKDMNYVLFCHQKAHAKEVKAKEQGPQVQEESSSQEGKRSKRSCLKANRRGSAEEKTSEISDIATASAEAEEADRKTVDSTEIHSVLYHEEHKSLVESIKRRRRATYLARVQDYLSQTKQEVPKLCSVDSDNGLADTKPQRLHHFQPMPTPWASSASFVRIRQKKRASESRQVLTYHQIPLLTLDWSNDKSQRWGTTDVDDIWTGGMKRTSSKTSEENNNNAPSVSDLWEAFLKDTDEDTDDKPSVCDIWQAFLKGPDCKSHSGVPESEWLQTAASVSPSNHKQQLQTQYAVSEQQHTFQVGTGTPTLECTRASAEWQSVSHAQATILANAALNAEEHQPAEVCTRTPRDDNAAAHDTSLKSETSPVTDTLQEFGLTGATPVSEGSVDSSAQRHKHAVWERERERKIAKAGGGGGEEPSKAHIDDLVTSSGETGTTEMTAMPESQNASAVDRISQGARPAEGLSYSGEGEVTGTAHNATDDTMAFRETIRQGTKDGGRFVLFTSRQGVEEGCTPNCTEKKVYTEEEIFRPQETEESEISQRYADEKKCEEFRPNQNGENALKQNETDEDGIRLGQSRADEEFRQSQMTESEFKFDESEHDEVMSNHKDVRKTKREVGVSRCTERQSGVEVQFNQEKVEEDPTLTQTEEYMEMKYAEMAQISNLIEDGTSQSRGGKHSIETKKVEESRPFQVDSCNSNPMEMVELRLNQTQEDDVKSQKEEAVGGEISPQEDTVKERRLAMKELRHPPAILDRIEEDMSQRDKDEKVSIGKLKMEAMEELMDDAESTREESKNPPAELKERELSAKVESSRQDEYKKLSEGTKGPITADDIVALELIESGRGEIFTERRGQDLVEAVLEEVLDWKDGIRAFERESEIGEGKTCRLADIPGVIHGSHLAKAETLPEEDSNEAFDSGVFSLTATPTYANITMNLYQGLNQMLAASSDKQCAIQSSWALTETLISPKPTLKSSPSGEGAAESDVQHPALLVTDEENYNQIEETSLSHHQTCSQSEVAAYKESFNQSARPPTSSSEKLDEARVLVRWSVLHFLIPVTRTLVYALLVAGFFFITLLYDFPACFALYACSLCWWFCQWKRHQATVTKGMVG